MSLRAAAVQLRTSADRHGTLARASELIRKAAQDHSAQLVVLPEALVVTVRVASSISIAEAFNKLKNEKNTTKIVDDHQNTTLCLTVILDIIL